MNVKIERYAETLFPTQFETLNAYLSRYER